MNQLGGFPLLTLIVFLPGLGALIAALIPAEKKQIWRWLTFLIAAANLFISLFLYMGWINEPDGSLQFVDGPLDWIPSLGIQYHLGIDGISIHLVMLTTFITPLILLLAWSRSSRAQVVWILIFQVGLLGALVTLDLFLFLAFWLLARLVTFFLLANDAQPAMKPRAAQTSIRFLIATAVAAILLAIVIASLLSQGYTLSLSSLVEASIGSKPQAWMFWCIVVAMAITSGTFPLFNFVDLGDHVSPATQVLIRSLLVNLGGYGLIRFGMSLFPLATTRFAPIMIILGLVGLLYGALSAAASSSVSDTLGYWNVAQMSLAVIGLFSLQDMGATGAVMSFVGRGLGSAALLILPASKTRQDRATLGSIALACLSLIGMPGLAGFVGTSAMVMGISRWRWQAGMSSGLNLLLNWGTYGTIVFGLFIGIWGLFRMWQRLDKEPSDTHAQTPLARRTLIALPVLVALVFVGLRPLPFLNMVGPSVFRFLNDIESSIEKSSLEIQAGHIKQEQSSYVDESSLPTKNTSLSWYEIESDRLLTVSRIRVSALCPYLSAVPF
ncbi:MAG: hypothetical protein JXA89_24470 [Anaerolineae bacterium]|nr:hypothetical protein [Anaerolineae bacterium]